jgi:hypothetical protein
MWAAPGQSHPAGGEVRGLPGDGPSPLLAAFRPDRLDRR